MKGDLFDRERWIFRPKYTHAAGILLNLSWDKGSPVMSISVSESLMKKADEQSPVDVPSVLPAEDQPAEGKGFGRCRKRSRPAAAVKNDLTIARIHHMRFMNVPCRNDREGNRRFQKELLPQMESDRPAYPRLGDAFQQVALINNPLCQKSLIIGTPLIFGTLVC